MTTFSPERLEYERSLVNIMKVLVSGQFNPDFDYAQRVKDVYGLEVSAEDAKFAAMVALREKKADAQRAEVGKIYEFFRSENPFFAFIDDFAGGNHYFKIIPEHCSGISFSGDFISPEYVKWSEKRPQGKNESDKQYQTYLRQRNAALNHAEGFKSSYLAKEFVCQSGMNIDAKKIESSIIIFFRHLTRGMIKQRWEDHCAAMNQCPLTSAVSKRPPRYKRGSLCKVPHEVRQKEIEAKGIKVMFEKIIQRYQHFSHTEKIFRCITIIAEVLLLLALCNRFEYGFYTFLRFVVCAAFVGLVINQRVPPLVKVFTIMGAILYNPIVPVHIGDRDVWCVINVLSIPLFIIGECFVYLNEKKD